MNLLTDGWIPIQHQGTRQKITLQQLLCGEKSGELCLPRDDLELACLQLLAAITQVCFTPPDRKILLSRLKKPLSDDEFQAGIKDKTTWFDLNHPDTPFMQIRGVTGKPNLISKILAGTNDGKNKKYLNDKSLTQALCTSCLAIALFNHATCSPSWCGGVKAGIRGATPLTTMVYFEHLRIRVWLNVLDSETLNRNGYILGSLPNWIKKQNKIGVKNSIKQGEPVHKASLGLERALFWQPAHIEIMPSSSGVCSCCNISGDVFREFKFEKFSYEYRGEWKHLYSPRIFSVKSGDMIFSCLKLEKDTPLWTQLPQIIFCDNNQSEGYEAAPVVESNKKSLSKGKLDLSYGGYVASKAQIIERNFSSVRINNGWHENPQIIHKIVSNGLAYKAALIDSLDYLHGNKKKKIDGVGLDLKRICEIQFYQSSSEHIDRTLEGIDFSYPLQALDVLSEKLDLVVRHIFEQLTQPYRQEPKMLKALALARRSLNKSLADLKPVISKGN